MRLSMVERARFSFLASSLPLMRRMGFTVAFTPLVRCQPATWRGGWNGCVSWLFQGRTKRKRPAEVTCSFPGIKSYLSAGCLGHPMSYPSGLALDASAPASAVVTLPTAFDALAALRAFKGSFPKSLTRRVQIGVLGNRGVNNSHNSHLWPDTVVFRVGVAIIGHLGAWKD